MNDRPADSVQCGEARVERATGMVRPMAWIVALACALPVLWMLAAAAAHAQDPRAAAAQIGQAGQAAAGAVARDAASAAAVPGFSGTDVPQRSLNAQGMEDAASALLADPADPGGEAGRAVIEGAAMRPDAAVAPGDPGVVRAQAIGADPRDPAHGAGGLVSGSVTGCGADVDAGRGGSCGRATWCVGADCETVAPQSNTGFVDAAARLNMAVELGGDEFDRRDLRFFRGERRECTIAAGGLADCCSDSGLLVGLAGCSVEERGLAEERHAGNTHYLGRYCASRILGVCVRRQRAWCVFGSKLGRILQEQGRGQLGIGWGSCRGLTVAEIERIDFDRLELSEFTDNLTDASRAPSVTLPEADGTRTIMRERIRDFFGEGG